MHEPLSDLPNNSGLNGWFTAELLPHEAALRAYLRHRFPALADPSDIVQEAYARLLRIHQQAEIKCPRALLFTTARNVAVDFLRHQRVLPIQPITDSMALPVLDEGYSSAELIDQIYERKVLAEALLSLPERCREVMMLRHLENLSYKEIAARLGISPETVKIHIAKGLRRCTEFFAERGLTPGEDYR
jgi:RNA polymerase sigma factor (sigma-70 family)